MIVLIVPFVALHAAQDTTAPRLEITGVNASHMPVVSVTANVYDNLGQPIRGLGAADFALTGDLVGLAQISSVENITDNNLPFAVVLAVDVSSSMAGTPLANAKLAARAFIENIGENDPVAILTFSEGVQVVQDYTTDKHALTAAIDGMAVDGRTALYQGAFDAIQRAADSPTPRRAVILLSDGAEYGGISQVGRPSAANEATVRGVPVYTIGLGFGADRTYLQQLSDATNARAYESPTSEELTAIYTDLAARLRSQYVITLDVPLALDGTQYNLGLQVTTPQGSADATAVLRAPIPVPIVRLPNLSDPISTPTDVTATVLADDPITSVSFEAGGNTTIATEAPYVIHIDPVDYLPGSYRLTVSATDADGDTGSDVLPFTVAALPSEIVLSPDLASLGAIAEPQTVTVHASGQTPPTDISVDLGQGAAALGDDHTFSIDPIQFPIGANALSVTVTNEGGVTSTQSFPFTVAALPPRVSVVGLQDGQSVAAPVTFTVAVTAQDEVASITASAGTVTLHADASGAFTIDPMAFAPGAKTLVVTATTVGGRSGSAEVNFVVAALPPQIVVNGLSAGDTVSADRNVSFDFVTQSPVIHVAVFVDGEDLAHLVRAPFGVALHVLDYAPGDHLMRIIADNSDGQEGSLDLPFTVASEPAATATATTVLATQAAAATSTQHAVATAVAVQATDSFHATGTQIANASETAVSQMVTQAFVATATQAFVATATQVAQVAATSTAAQATQAFEATGTQIAERETQAAQAASETAVAQMATDSFVATATQAAQATQSFAMTGTQNANATAAQEAANATATRAVESTRVAQAMLDAAATQNAANATATESANATAAGIAHAAATQVAQATATQAALGTAGAQQTATAEQALIQGTGDARATQQVIGQATGTAAALLNAQSTQAAADAAATQSALDANATGSALEATRTAQAAAANQSVAATQTAEQSTAAAQATATSAAQSTAAQSTAAQATSAAQATFRAQAVAQAQAGTLAALSTANAEARLSAQATQDARATRSAGATATHEVNATSTAVQATQSALDVTATKVVDNATATQGAQETQVAGATATQAAGIAQATQAAQATLDALEATATERVIAATATRSALETQAALQASATQGIANATATAQAQATESAQGTQAAQAAAATAERVGQQTATSQRLADSATGTASADATERAAILATDAQATVSMGATETADAQSTLETRQTAIGPTATPVSGSAQGAPSETPQPSPTLTEVQAQEPPASSNIAPILIVVVVIIVIILVLVLIMRGSGAPRGRS